jgi:hypothetical protein
MLRNLRRNKLGLAAGGVYDLLRFSRTALSRRHPLSPDQAPAPFFIIGSGRCGTTLLRAMLVSHGSVAIPPESNMIPAAIRKYSALSFLDWADLCRLVIADFESLPDFPHWQTSLAGAYAKAVALPSGQRALATIIDVIYRCYIEQHFPAASIWGDKTPANTTYVEWIDQVFPNARYIHMLRDGRDVVSSFVKSGIHSDLGRACEDWKARVAAARRFGEKSGERYLEVRYEDLVREPRQQISRVCALLGLEFREAMLRHERIAPRLTDVAVVPHHSQVMRGINADRIGGWTRNLSAQQQAYVQRTLRRGLIAAGYQG